MKNNDVILDSMTVLLMKKHHPEKLEALQAVVDVAKTRIQKSLGVSTTDLSTITKSFSVGELAKLSEVLDLDFDKQPLISMLKERLGITPAQPKKPIDLNKALQAIVECHVKKAFNK